MVLEEVVGPQLLHGSSSANAASQVATISTAIVGSRGSTCELNGRAERHSPAASSLSPTLEDRYKRGFEERGSRPLRVSWTYLLARDLAPAFHHRNESDVDDAVHGLGSSW